MRWYNRIAEVQFQLFADREIHLEHFVSSQISNNLLHSTEKITREFFKLITGLTRFTTWLEILFVS